MKNIFIPNKIKVGFQVRKATYTGKLAYVIYYDEKNKLRKETSWQGWRDKSIDSKEFENVPTNGFVLNKKVGGYSSGWNSRQTYTRVYDPRGFEFEITIENLLYILEHTNSIKGKGLEGEFVYSWSGKDLVLLPTGTPDYEAFATHTQLLMNNTFIKPKNLRLGYTYLTKLGDEVVYLGRYNSCNSNGDSLNKLLHFVAIKKNDSCRERDYEIWSYKTVNKTFLQETGCIDGMLFSDLINYASTDKLWQSIDLADHSKDEYVDYSFDELIKYVEVVNSNRHYILLETQNELAKGRIESTPWNNSKYSVSINFSEILLTDDLEEVFMTFKPKYIQRYDKSGIPYRKDYYNDQK